ncbi:phiSA1p31-related protein [Embleya hyalina]|uniref:Uncharacterized protein n=1 Tax=Embleya hyalina TaxID=516124 RepID=A0A401Z3X9_9ACTN|nr:phiSA1p31-related protein [Embleya hyalina]GCE01548.1 hypothetical protein EHYA_09314 [Embleya hyalina]
MRNRIESLVERTRVRAAEAERQWQDDPTTPEFATAVAARVHHYLHHEVDGIAYDLHEVMVDRLGREWTHTGRWTENETAPLMTTEGPSWGAPVPLPSVIAEFGPIYPLVVDPTDPVSYPAATRRIGGVL